MVNISKYLPPEMKIKYVDLLKKYKYVFAWSYVLGMCYILCMCVCVGAFLGGSPGGGRYAPPGYTQRSGQRPEILFWAVFAIFSGFFLFLADL
jgi:hypothetical protein